MVCITYLLELFVQPLFELGSYRFEWPYICSLVLLITLVVKRKHSEYRPVVRSLFMFFLWCVILLFMGIIRYSENLVLVGALHLIRMATLFVPFMWLLISLDSESRESFYFVLRKYLFVSLIALLVMGFLQGGINNSATFSTVGVGKNSLSYTIVCIQLLFSLYENNNHVKRPYNPFVWQSLCILICLFTKSGTGVAFSLFILAWYLLKSLKINIYGKIIVVMLITSLGFAFLSVDNLVSIFDALNIKKLSDFFYEYKYSGGESLGRTTDVRLRVQEDVLKDFDFDMALGRFYYYYFSTHGYTAHQLFLQILYDTGIVGVLLFLRYCYTCVKYSGVKVAVILIFLYSFIEVFLIQYLSLIVLALLITYNVNQKKGDKNENCDSGSVRFGKQL